MNINLVLPKQVHLSEDGNTYFEIQDKESPLLYWVIKRTKCYHYSFCQAVKHHEKQINCDTIQPRFVKKTSKQLKLMHGIDFSETLRSIRK